MMTQYKDRIELQRQILLAEKYINNIKDIHAHSLTSMWYENNQTAKDAVKGVVDITYMDGRIERTINETGRQYTIVEGRMGEDLVQEVTRNLADSGKQLV
tara:strand:+ start:1653 stop:1952 length:300 start_codon:yes stop_codon:yes gene_type:complete